MPLELVHVSDIHFGSGEGHGVVNPKTGLNIRFEDFGSALARAVDFAVERDVDLFLFSGDAYKSPSPEPLYQNSFARQMKRLSDARIQTVLLVGNHDQILKSGSTTSLSVFQTLGIPHVRIIDRPEMIRLRLKRGDLQLIGIPHVVKQFLLTNEAYSELEGVDLDRLLLNHVDSIVKGFLAQVDGTTPLVLTAHLMMDRARAGAEEELMIGYALTFPSGLFIDERIDYVGLGHVHKHQILHSAKPLMLYAGSIERVDFSEESEDKGFVHVLVERGRVEHKFHSIDPRPFITTEIDLREASPEVDLTALVLAKVKARSIDGAVLRICYKARKEQVAALDEDKLRASLGEALSIRFQATIDQVERPARVPGLKEDSVLKPLEALNLYLNQNNSDNKDRLLERAKQLIAKLQDEENK